MQDRKRRLVLVDGINFFYRGVWSHSAAMTVRGEDMSCCLAYFRNLAGLLRRFGMYDSNRFVVCWDAGYDERTRISTEAVNAGIIPKTYKQERREARECEDPATHEQAMSFMRQMGEARTLTALTVVGQASVPGEEADDVIGSYARKFHGDFDEIILVTTDRDYYQLLDDRTMMYNSGRAEFTTIDSLRSEYGLESGSQWIDVGALAGEAGRSSDTIYGVPGIGYKTAARLIAEHGTLDRLVEDASAELAGDILACGNDVRELCARVGDRRYRLAHHRKEAKVLAHLDVVRIARQLKAMRTFLDVELPDPVPSWTDFDRELRARGIPLGQSMTEDLTEPGRYADIA